MALCVGYANQLAERMLRHNGYRTVGFKSQLVQVHPSSVLKADEEGTLPDYVVCHVLIATSRPYMRNVCAVEMTWVMPILEKLEKLDTNKLSGGSAHIEEVADIKQTEILYKKVDGDAVPDDRESKIKAARERFLARKGKN